MTAPINTNLKNLTVVVSYIKLSPVVGLNYDLTKLALADEIDLSIVAFSDVATMVVTSKPTDVVTFVEVIGIGVTKPIIEEALGAVDTVSLTFNKVFTDSITLSEELTSTTGLGATPTDSTSLADVLTVDYTKALTETIVLV